MKINFVSLNKLVIFTFLMFSSLFLMGQTDRGHCGETMLKPSGVLPHGKCSVTPSSFSIGEHKNIKKGKKKNSTNSSTTPIIGRPLQRRNISGLINRRRQQLQH